MGALINDLVTRISEVIDRDSLRIKSISKGFRFTCTVLANESCGMCYSIFNQDPIDSCKYINSKKSMKDLDIRKLLQFVKNVDDDLERVIGISTLNAVSQHILWKNVKKYRIKYDTDPLDHLKVEETDRVVMIGNIRGFLPRLQKTVQDVVVIDDGLKNMSLPYLKSPETSQEHLNRADVVFITGSAIANRTLEKLIQWSENAREITVVGPTAGFVAEPLFARGVTILSSMQVLEPAKVLKNIVEGGGTPNFKVYCRKYNIFR
ncbi:MAG: DUF364 domain-containing protein [Candidatus Helarchaeota archaeon]|nr:DUF364 domain-containing protein [Candidatus Helarchaeota archaeon]